jgi:hypothetical protein
MSNKAQLTSCGGSLFAAWLERLGKPVTVLLAWQAFLEEARTKPPPEVDAERLFALFEQAYQEMDILLQLLDQEEFDDFFRQITARDLVEIYDLK